MSPHAHASTGRSVKVAVLTVSDTRTISTDESGRLAGTLAREAGHLPVDHRCVRDEPDDVRDVLDAWLADEGIEAILITGGTGISARDRTFETVVGLLERRLDGYGEIFRQLSFAEIGPAAILSRAVAGIARGRPVFTMPGAPAAVRLAMTALILPELAHIVGEATRQS